MSDKELVKIYHEHQKIKNICSIGQIGLLLIYSYLGR